MRPALVGALVLLGACAALEPPAPTIASTPKPEPPAARTRSSAEELVAYLARIHGMNEAALAAEAARQHRGPGPLAPLKAALALALSAQSDESEILALVDPVMKKDNGDREARAMAGFLQALAGERRRLKEGAAAAAGRLRDERRQREAEKQRADALQQKLEALTDLEKSLSTRSTPDR